MECLYMNVILLGHNEIGQNLHISIHIQFCFCTPVFGSRGEQLIWKLFECEQRLGVCRDFRRIWRNSHFYDFREFLILFTTLTEQKTLRDTELDTQSQPSAQKMSEKSQKSL